MVGTKLQQITMWCLFLGPFSMLQAIPEPNMEGLYYKDESIAFDWRTHGVISAVSDQNIDFTAWDEVTRESIESLHAIQTGQLLSLSTQEVHDCCPYEVPVSTSFGCLVNLGGLCSAGAYKNGSGCLPESCSRVAKVTGWKPVTPNNEDLMVKAIHTSPLMVGVNASSFATYTNEILDDPDCGTGLNHYVQLVGYGTENGKDFWVAKNSWGLGFGIDGYIYVSRGKNMCGIAMNVTYAVNQ